MKKYKAIALKIEIMFLDVFLCSRFVSILLGCVVLPGFLTCPGKSFESRNRKVTKMTIVMPSAGRRNIAIQFRSEENDTDKQKAWEETPNPMTRFFST